MNLFAIEEQMMENASSLTFRISDTTYHYLPTSLGDSRLRRRHAVEGGHSSASRVLLHTRPLVLIILTTFGGM